MLNHTTFMNGWKKMLIVFKSVQKMKNNSFACFVVSDYRDKKGFYSNFVSKTIDAFESAGSKLYNEAILVQPAGSAPLRINGYFQGGRKLAKTHQNVLVFCKGSWRETIKKIKGEKNV